MAILRSTRGKTAAPEIERLIELLAKLPGLGPRSARRAALHLLKRKDQLMAPLGQAMAEAAQKIAPCGTCGALDAVNPCALCADPTRDNGVICVVADMADVWALERANALKGRYHVLGGVLSAIDGIGPEDLRVASLLARIDPTTREVILALPATVDGQTTAHYLAEKLVGAGAQVTRLSHGVPVGGELDVLDDGTLFAALAARRPA